MTCVSMECPFQLVCKNYNFEVDRSGGCKTQEFIIKKAIELSKKQKGEKK